MPCPVGAWVTGEEEGRGSEKEIMLMFAKTNKSSSFKCGGILGENRSLIKKKKEKHKVSPDFILTWVKMPLMVL